MEKFLGILLVVIFSFLLLRWIMRLVLPLVLGWLVKKLMKKTFHQQGFQFGNFARDYHDKSPEGNVTVETSTTKSSSTRKKTDDEYVEFEEIKD